MEETALLEWLAGIRQTFRKTIIPDLRTEHARGQAVAAYGLLGIIERKLRVGEDAATAVATAMEESLDQAWALIQPAGAGERWRGFEDDFLARRQKSRESGASGTQRVSLLASVMEELLRALWDPELGIPQSVAARARSLLRAALRKQLELEKESIHAHSYSSAHVAPGDRD